MSKKIIERATEIITKNIVNGGEYTGQYCVLALVDLEGYPTASVITPSKTNGIKQRFILYENGIR